MHVPVSSPKHPRDRSPRLLRDHELGRLRGPSRRAHSSLPLSCTTDLEPFSRPAPAILPQPAPPWIAQNHAVDHDAHLTLAEPPTEPRWPSKPHASALASKNTHMNWSRSPNPCRGPPRLPQRGSRCTWVPSRRAPCFSPRNCSWRLKHGGRAPWITLPSFRHRARGRAASSQSPSVLGSSTRDKLWVPGAHSRALVDLGAGPRPGPSACMVRPPYCIWHPARGAMRLPYVALRLGMATPSPEPHWRTGSFRGVVGPCCESWLVSTRCRSMRAEAVMATSHLVVGGSRV